MNLRKFPVTSKSGAEYLVEIRQTRWGDFAVGVYKEKTGIFGRKRLQLVNNEPWYCGERHDFDFVKMAIAEVEDYEAEVQASIGRKKIIAGNIAKFNEWDGDLS